jgi:predicted nucleotidyltransferase
VNERIAAELARIERSHEVRALFAVESGSRAWGFASPDSDFDVRFVYVHRRDWYVSVFEQRDVIEEMLPDALDVSGWDLRKALRLFGKCNLALNEWLSSPIIYSEAPGFRAELAALMPAYFNPIAATHHYRRMAEQALGEGFEERRIGIKKLFYALRAMLACRWIAHARSQPPTEFSKLAAQSWVSGEERSWIDTLLREKAQAVEGALVQLAAERVDAIQLEVQRYKLAADALDGPAGGRRPGELDEFLRRWIAAAGD